MKNHIHNPAKEYFCAPLVETHNSQFAKLFRADIFLNEEKVKQKIEAFERF